MTTRWIAVCRLADLTPERGAAVLIGEQQIAVIRTHDDQVYAISQHDPTSSANVMSRGIVGTRTINDHPTPTIASPITKHTYDLTTGESLDDLTIVLPTWPTRITDGGVEIGVHPEQS
jgi:nitrite reductase (NADH) small subunit